MTAINLDAAPTHLVDLPNHAQTSREFLQHLVAYLEAQKRFAFKLNVDDQALVRDVSTNAAYLALRYAALEKEHDGIIPKGYNLGDTMDQLIFELSNMLDKDGEETPLPIRKLAYANYDLQEMIQKTHSPLPDTKKRGARLFSFLFVDKDD